MISSLNIFDEKSKSGLPKPILANFEKFTKVVKRQYIESSNIAKHPVSSEKIPQICQEREYRLDLQAKLEEDPKAKMICEAIRKEIERKQDLTLSNQRAYLLKLKKWKENVKYFVV